MVSLNEFIDKDLTAADVLHSSGYVSASGVGGTMSGLSLEKRRELRKKARVVGSYEQSDIGRRSNMVKSRTADQKAGRIYDASTGTFQSSASYTRQGNRARINKVADAQKIDASISKRQHAIQPPARGINPTRGFNPYA